MASLGLPHAGNWLSVVPSPSLGLHLRAAEFVPIMKYRLGLPVYSSAGTCPACSQQSDRMGDHSLGCGKTGDRIARHNMLRDVILKQQQRRRKATCSPAPLLDQVTSPSGDGLMEEMRQ